MVQFYEYRKISLSPIARNININEKPTSSQKQQGHGPALFSSCLLADLRPPQPYYEKEISFPCRINKSSSLFYSTIIIFPCSSNFTGKIHNRVVGHLAVFSSIIPMVTWILAAISFCGLNLKFALQCHVSQSRYRKYEYFSYYIKRKTIEKYSYIAYLCV